KCFRVSTACKQRFREHDARTRARGICGERALRVVDREAWLAGFEMSSRPSREDGHPVRVVDDDPAIDGERAGEVARGFEMKSFGFSVGPWSIGRVLRRPTAPQERDCPFKHEQRLDSPALILRTRWCLPLIAKERFDADLVERALVFAKCSP